MLHTADWHIGRSLFGKKRYSEFEAFLAWLADVIVSEQVDVLLVAGDVFDTIAPSNRSLELYYRFLCNVAESQCRHVVVTAGNHDSASLLNAPREILRYLNVYVVGSAAEAPEDEVLVLNDAAGAAELIVCAVPYLRDRDIRIAEAGETPDDKERKLLKGIHDHYQAVCAVAEEKLHSLAAPVPLIAMGHLFTAGGETVEGDGVRDLYVGSLAHFDANLFPKCIDYLALGHLHSSQKVNRSDTFRYSGSPLPMGFGEAGQKKSLCLVEFHGSAGTVRLIDVPTFQTIARIQGRLDSILARIAKLAASQSAAWLEIVYDSDEVIGDLRERLEEAIAKTDLEILRVRNTRTMITALSSAGEDETLDSLDEVEVFVRCMDSRSVPEQQRQDLILAYKETLYSLTQDDVNAQ